MEAHDLVIQAWTRPGPFAFEGKHYHFEYVNVWPRPYQKPHPPIWCPSQGSSETIDWAAHPDRKYTYVQNFNPYTAAVKYLNEYRQVAHDKYGYEASAEQIGAPVTLLGVGPGREQVIWTEAGLQTSLGRGGDVPVVARSPG